MNDVEYNGSFYTVTLPSGVTWSFDEGDKDLTDIEDAIQAWQIWRNYVQTDMLRGQL